MSDTPKQNDWSKPAAMAIPKEGYFKDKAEQGRYGPIFPKTPACHGFTIIAKVDPGPRAGRPRVRQEHRECGGGSAALPRGAQACTIYAGQLFEIKGETYFMYQGIFDTDFDKYTEDAVALFSADRHHHCLREPRRLSQGLENQRTSVRQVRPRTPAPELFGIRGIPVCERRGDQEGAQVEGGVHGHARPDAVIGIYEVDRTTVDEERNDEDEHERSDGGSARVHRWLQQR